jgi:pyruvate, orthophosphate dikinase
VVGFIEATFRFWASANPAHVEPFVPPSIFEQIDLDSPYVKGVNRLMTHLEKERGLHLPEDLLTLDEAGLRSCLEAVENATERDVDRLVMAARFYNLLHQKYTLALNPNTAGDMGGYLALLKAEAFPSLDKLQVALREPDLYRKLPLLLDYMELLKELILSEQTYEVREDIYKKRHFTVDIPSMYGSYHEMKFDALGLTFRLESLVNVYFEEIVNRLDLTLITKETFYQIHDLLKLFNRALKLDGISSVEIESQLELLAHSLAARGFTFTQYLDIFKGFARAVTNVINDYFNNIHENNLNRILSRIPRELVLDKFLASDDRDDPEKMKLRVSEIFLREKIALSLGLQQLDQLLSQVLKTLFHQSYRLPDEKLRLLLNYDPQRAMTSIPEPEDRAIGIIHLGNKGHNLVKLNRLGFPVPPGFIITTEVFRCREIVENYPPAEQNFKDQIAWHIASLEKLTGKKFGDPGNPLLFSVRSGSSISQPGMMDTFLDVGMNDDIAAGLAEKNRNPWFAWDNYRRFIQCYGMSFDLERDDFDAVMGDFKKKLGVPFKRDFSGSQMRALALAYKDLVRNSGIDLLEDPFDQLLVTIQKVLNSWESAKAKAYRKIIGISDDWGTAVTVQSMVYGNISPSSGSGVFFTHNPKWSEDDLRLWGDFSVGNQGEDVVSGLVTTLPISIIQQQNEMRNTDITLETHFPDIYKTLREWAAELIYKKGWSPQEIEFTFESPQKKDLYVLQSRNMSIRERKKYFAFDPEGVEAACLLGNGVGVSGGAMSGRVVFSLEEIDHWRQGEPETHLILLRADTVPDDIREINAADGILTARGGGTSHASVVAHKLGKTCVVGCGTMVCDEKGKKSFFGNQRIESGDFLSINGQDGTVYKGFMKVKET